MRFSMTLGKRIAAGISLMLLLMLAVGGAGYFGLTRVMGVTTFYQEINELRALVASVKAQRDLYLLACMTDDGQARARTGKETHARLDQALKAIHGVMTHEGVGQDGSEKLKSAESELNGYRSGLNDYIRLENEKKTIEGFLSGAYAPMLDTIQKAGLFVEEMLMRTQILQGVSTAYLSKGSAESWKSTETEFSKTLAAIEDFLKKVDSSEQLREAGQIVLAQFKEIKAKLETHHGHVLKQATLRGRMDAQAGKLDTICSQLGSASVERLRNQTESSVTLIFGFIAAALLLGVGYAVYSIRKIVGKLRGVIQGISEGAGQVSGAAAQVSSASQSLAEGASQQAASIEETSSSLEEMASMTRQNADHAGEADSLMQETKQIVASANEVMAELTGSMKGISTASEETSKIIKAIDEISFQTNLLALNAAVEAARAGQAGAGFAVVADEVRNLAMRAADAARNTAGLIEETVKRVKDGGALVDRGNEAFARVAESAGRVAELVAEISAASRDQAQGIEQVNKAVADMDKVVQQTAASAEESASASEEMNAQAEQMKSFVQDLAVLVAGKERA
ncbi:MAG: methyl-accepting chemotaxis protein [Thermodesulfobacteriota bacterium]